MNADYRWINKRRGKTLVISQGTICPVRIMIFVLLGGVISTLVGVSALFTSLFLGGLLIISLSIIAILYTMFTKEGVEFSYNTREVRQYIYSFFVRRGSWKKLDSYNDIALLSSRKVQRLHYGYVSGMSSSSRFMTYDVYLLGKNHWKKILVNSYESKEEAQKMIKYLVENIGVNYVVYSPKRISKRR
jgi:hypothetical protein